MSAATATAYEQTQAPTSGHNAPPPLPEILKQNYAALAADIAALAERANKAPRKIETDEDLDAVANIVKDVRFLTSKADTARKREKEPFLTGGKDVDAFFKAHLERLERMGAAFQKVADDHIRRKAEEARREAAARAEEARKEAERQAEIARKAEEAGRAKTAARAEDKAAAAEDLAAEQAALAQAKAADLTRTRTDSGAVVGAKAPWTFQITDQAAIPLDKLRPYLKPEHIEAAIRAAVKLGVRELTGVRIFQEVKANIR